MFVLGLVENRLPLGNLNFKKLGKKSSEYLCKIDLARVCQIDFTHVIQSQQH